MGLKDYSNRISGKAWYLIGCSVFYLLLAVLLSQVMNKDVGIMLAQLVYVAILAFGLFFKPLRRKFADYDKRQEIKAYLNTPGNAVEVATQQHLNSIFGARPADADVPPSESYDEGSSGVVPDSVDRR
jgi:hypothetical protein